MTELEIFKSIRNWFNSDQEAKNEAEHIARLPEKKQRLRLEWVRKRITKAGTDFILKIIELERKGRYKKSILLKVKHVHGMTLEKAVQQTKWSRIIVKHRINIGGSYTGGKEYHWPYCICGWEGKKIYGKDSYRKADRVKCPLMLASLKAKNLPEEL